MKIYWSNYHNDYVFSSGHFLFWAKLYEIINYVDQVYYTIPHGVDTDEDLEFICEVKD